VVLAKKRIKQLRVRNKGSCPTGKVVFSSFKRMKKVMARANKERNVELYCYKCRECGKWHLSSMSKEEFDRLHLDFRREL
jgi:hypothetical protein